MLIGSDQVRFINSLINIRLPADVSHLDDKTEDDFLKTKLLLLSSGVLGSLSFVLQVLAFPSFAMGAAIFFLVLIVLMLFGIYAAKSITVFLLGVNAFFAVAETVSSDNRLFPASMLAMSIISLCMMLMPKNNTNFFIFKALKRGRGLSADQLMRDHDIASRIFDDW